MLVSQIQKNFGDYEADFDLEDCDNILRIECTTVKIQPSRLISLLRDFGFNAEVLPD
ncbi:MAG: hypothetical protein JWQ06_1835 [Mucilaginibacter sp.]|nr:hypothetical protein [Mucilaginibacter sp.]